MRSNSRTLREKAVTAAILDACAAQIRCEADHPCVEDFERGELEYLARYVSDIATDIYQQSLGKRGVTADAEPAPALPEERG